MASPFPGMDPYLEAPDIWPDFHDALASEIRAELNGSLPGPYYARLEMRPEVGIVEGEEFSRRRVVPDVAVVRPVPGAGGGVAVLSGNARTAVSDSFEIEVASETISHPFVEIRDPSRGHLLITLIEIVSPSNKLPGPDREAYERKQREVLGSSASLIEIDLLRTGDRLVPIEVDQFVRNRRADYMVAVNRAWLRPKKDVYTVFTIVLEEPLPVIAVPLREGQPELPLDLQSVFQRAYAGGPYRRGAVDYDQPPRPPVSDERDSWLNERLLASGMRLGV